MLQGEFEKYSSFNTERRAERENPVHLTNDEHLLCKASPQKKNRSTLGQPTFLKYFVYKVSVASTEYIINIFSAIPQLKLQNYDSNSSVSVERAQGQFDVSDRLLINFMLLQHLKVNLRIW